MEAVEDCRICSDEGLYNIFNDELCFDEENNKTKIYVVLNNFQFEKARKVATIKVSGANRRLFCLFLALCSGHLFIVHLQNLLRLNVRFLLIYAESKECRVQAEV